MAEHAPDDTEILRELVEAQMAQVYDRSCAANAAKVAVAVFAPVLERQRAEIVRLTDFGLDSRDRHQAELEQLRGDLERVAVALESFSEDYRTDDGVAADAERFVRHMSNLNEDFRRILASKSEALAEEADSAVSLRREVERLRAALDQARDERDDVLAEVERLRGELAARIDVGRTEHQELEQLRAENDQLRDALAESDLGAQVLAQWEAIAAADADRDRLEAERDALKAAIADVRRLQEMTIATSCRIHAIDQATDTIAVLDRALDPASTRESSEDAERIADERPTGVHAFKQNPAATQVSVCICGKWRDHHVHGADPCGCDECRTSRDAEEATDGQ